MRVIWRLAREDAGAETVEYALVIGLMSLATVAGISAAGDEMRELWNKLASALASILGLFP